LLQNSRKTGYRYEYIIMLKIRRASRTVINYHGSGCCLGQGGH
jgi:hypothetical protein